MDSFRLKNLFHRDTGSRERRGRERRSLTGEYTVLIVDDSTTVVYAIKAVLEQNGYRTLTAVNGEEAVAMTREYKPDLVLMDVIMPGMTGYQATRILYKDPRTRHIPVVIISASEQPTEQAWCKRLGAKGFLPKPIHRGQLFPCIEDLLGLHRLNWT